MYISDWNVNIVTIFLAIDKLSFDTHTDRPYLSLSLSANNFHHVTFVTSVSIFVVVLFYFHWQNSAKRVYECLKGIPLYSFLAFPFTVSNVSVSSVLSFRWLMVLFECVCFMKSVKSLFHVNQAIKKRNCQLIHCLVWWKYRWWPQRWFKAEESQRNFPFVRCMIQFWAQRNFTENHHRSNISWACQFENGDKCIVPNLITNVRKERRYATK